jgi:hypothetical protein
MFAENLLDDRLLAKHRSGTYAPEVRSRLMSVMNETRAAIGNKTADAIVKYVDAALSASVATTAASPDHARERERVTLPADAHPAYDGGVWDHGATYSRGALVTDHGTLWSCQASETKDRPGTSSNWRLMVKNQQKTGTR